MNTALALAALVSTFAAGGIGLGQTEDRAAGHPAKCPAGELDNPGYGPPAPIVNRSKIQAMRRPEHKEALKEAGLARLAGSDRDTGRYPVTIFRAADGTVYCADDGEMGFWIRKDNLWDCLVCGVRVVKTFGGAPPHMPVRYPGKGFFAFPSTLPDDTRDGKGDFPVADATTCLLNGNAGEVPDRAPVFEYDHNPPVKVPEECYARIGVKPLPGPGQATHPELLSS